MFLKHNWPGILWFLLIGILSGMPGNQLPKVHFFLGIIAFDKIIHIFFYSVLTLLLIVGFQKQFQFRLLRYFPLRFSFFISFFYGILIEVLQYFLFLGRSFEVNDILANTAGTIMGVFLFYLIYGLEAKKTM